MKQGAEQTQEEIYNILTGETTRLTAQNKRRIFRLKARNSIFNAISIFIFIAILTIGAALIILVFFTIGKLFQTVAGL